MNQHKAELGGGTCSASSGGQAHQREGTKAFLPPEFDNLEEYLTALQTFLTACEPIINLMIVDYFTTNSWDTRMPQDWREAFESEQGKLSSLDLMQLVSLGKLRDFKSGPSPRNDIPIRPKTSVDHGHEPQDWPESLKDFVRMVKKLSINRTLDPDFTKFKDTLDIHLIPGMTPKKLHEVEILSGLIASYAKDHSIRSVIDLGAGQGYLSRVLAFQHQLCVLGVDSNTIQTCGAQTTQKRTERLFLNKTKQKGSSISGKKASTKKNRPIGDIPVPPSKSAELTTTAMESVSTKESPGISESSLTTTTPLENGSPIPKKKVKTGSRSRSNSPADSIGRSNSPCKRSNRSRKSKGKKDDSQNIPSSEIATTAITETPTLVAPVTSSSTPLSSPAPTTSTSTFVSSTSLSEDPNPQHQGQRKLEMDSSNNPDLATTPGSNFQLQHITHHITASTLPTLLKEHFPKKSRYVSCCERNEPDRDEQREEEEERWTLCGLHACGDLTSNMIKLYLESSATCLFSVGCCYHWITERYDKEGNIVIFDGSHGFPLSAVFNRHKAHLGEHAKMTACQSPERWLKYQKETEDAIHGHYYRALLHKLMVENGLYPGPPAVAPVLGRMGKHRLKGFPHYLMTAVNRLHLPTDVIRPEDAQAAYDKYLEKDLYRIGILWALRTMLGPLFEGMILLDRATFLYENIVGDGENGKSTKTAEGSVQLVAGFDVVESPRNMILIALKN
ncbi:Methyltransferase-like protein 25 [Entomortierella lignicola]|nr:Methyltransferase-like protein 25 [Entomortierella lignicola]